MKKILLYILFLLSVITRGQSVMTSGSNVMVSGSNVMISSWTPALLANVVGWYEADAGITLSGSEVIQWNDLSGNNNHLLPDGGQNPDLVTNQINTKPIVRFNQANLDHLKFTSNPTMAAGWTVYVVYKKTNTTYPFILFGNETSPEYFCHNATIGGTYTLLKGSSYFYQTSAVHATSYRMERWQITSLSAANNYVNKTSTALSSSGMPASGYPTYTKVGRYYNAALGYQYSNGDIYMILIINSAVTWGGTDDLNIRNYIETKTALDVY